AWRDIQTPSRILHHFSCKGATNGWDVLKRMAVQLMIPTDSKDDLNVFTRTVLSELKSAVEKTDYYQHTRCHHILFFDKCESLITYNSESWFLNFLSEIRRILRSNCVTIVFSSYIRFEWRGPHYFERDGIVTGSVQGLDICYTLEIGHLKDKDILSTLQHFAPNVDPNPYLLMFQRLLGFPEAVAKVAQIYLICTGRGKDSALSSETLEKYIKTDLTLLQTLFGPRLNEVIDWVGWNNLLILRHVGSSLDSSASRECFQSMVSEDGEEYRWQQLCYQLERYYIIRELPAMQRLAVHPLVTFFCSTQFRAIQIAIRGHGTDMFSNRFTHFLCATLSSLDALSSLKGQQFNMVFNLVFECPNIKHVINMALFANEDSYEVYLKLAISGGGMLSLLCPREVINFFYCLYERSRVRGRSKEEQAVLLGLYGQALSLGTGTASVAQASGPHWQESIEHLSKAIEMLSRPGIEPSYYLVLFLKEKAQILSRQGKYDESLKIFKRAKNLFDSLRTHALGEALAVTERKLREIKLVTLLYETVPMIFKGQNAKAFERLSILADRFEQDFPNSRDLATVYNQKGLSKQRGCGKSQSLSGRNSDMEEAKESYMKSLRIRLGLVKINSMPLYAPLNNVAMLAYRDNDLSQFYRLLEQSLQISKDYNCWLHYYTGLSLIHLAEGSMGLSHFKSAMLYLKETERILSTVSKDHDLRLRALLEMVHVQVALNHQLQHQAPCAVDTGLYRDGELVGPAKHIDQQVTLHEETLSASDYLDRLINVKKEMKGTLSDDGHHFFLAAYEHALLLNWGWPKKFEEFKAFIVQYVEENDFVKLFKQETPQKYHLMYKHKNVYFYIKECIENGMELELDKFLERQVPACTICKSNPCFFTKDMWCKEINNIVRTQRDINIGYSSDSSESSTDSSECTHRDNRASDFMPQANQRNVSMCHQQYKAENAEMNVSPRSYASAIPTALSRDDEKTRQNVLQSEIKVNIGAIPNNIISSSSHYKPRSGGASCVESAPDTARHLVTVPSAHTFPNANISQIIGMTLNNSSCDNEKFLNQVMSCSGRSKRIKEPVEDTEIADDFSESVILSFKSSGKKPVENDEVYHRANGTVEVNLTQICIHHKSGSNHHGSQPVEDSWLSAPSFAAFGENFSCRNGMEQDLCNQQIRGEIHSSFSSDSAYLCDGSQPPASEDKKRKVSPVWHFSNSYNIVNTVNGSTSDMSSSGVGSTIKSSTDGLPSV
ncbi:hypothetical protein PoB_001674500, partial [Plakobranchus ocellatus]